MRRISNTFHLITFAIENIQKCRFVENIIFDKEGSAFIEYRRVQVRRLSLNYRVGMNQIKNYECLEAV